jgi:hypothetical protein
VETYEFQLKICWVVGQCKKIPFSNVTEKTLTLRGGGVAAIIKNTAQHWIEMVKVAKQETILLD